MKCVLLPGPLDYCFATTGLRAIFYEVDVTAIKGQLNDAYERLPLGALTSVFIGPVLFPVKKTLGKESGVPKAALSQGGWWPGLCFSPSPQDLLNHVICCRG